MKLASRMEGTRVRSTSAGIAAWLILLTVANSFGGRPQQPRANVAVDGMIVPQVQGVSLDSENEIAGLAKGSKPELVTWETLYALAVVRARAGKLTLSRTLDPAALGRQADRLGVADFARFRNDFFGGGVFRDPASDVFALLGRLQTIENARSHLAWLENLMKVLQELVQGQSSGLSRLDLDFVFAASVKARQRLDHQNREFRDGLDELKVALGLSPQAAIILDRKAMVQFHDVFESVATWERRPDRHLDDLYQIIAGLPDLGDVMLDGQPVLGAITVNPDQFEDVMTKVARLALGKQSGPAKGAADEGARAGVELQTRRRVRNLVEMRRAYADAEKGYELAVRLTDQAFERVHAPPSDGAPQRSLLLGRLIEQVANLTTCQDQLVELWTTFHAERLALYREIGVLPYTDWKSYYADLTARRTGAEDKRSN